MTKILEQASRVLAILGIALIVWAGMGLQTVKADAVQAPIQACLVIPAVVNGEAGWFTCQQGNCSGAGMMCRTNNTPKPVAGGGFTCCTFLGL